MVRRNILNYLHSLTKQLSPIYSPLPSLASFQLHRNAREEQPPTPERIRSRRNLSQLAGTDASCCRGEGEGESVGEAGTATRGVAMESFMKGIRGDAPSVLDMDPTHTVGGGVEDFYGEDHATEDQLVTPWTISVARSRIFF
jgi:hypothetical protein